ncbi:MAG TPA: acetylxylan esterase [candidate division Zixibacteria bacterium]|nr:acetylxylan esterase [candidate division Zixibacteria bacterium]
MQSTRVSALVTAVFLCAFAAHGAPVPLPEAPAYFFTADSFPALAAEGAAIAERNYVFWAWAREDSSVTLTAGGEEYFTDRPDPARAAPDRWTWRRLGTAVFAGGRIALTADREGGAAALCLATDRSFEPAASWALMRSRPFDPQAAPDGRARECRHINLAYPTYTFPSAEAWRARAAHLRDHILASCGLLPPPEKMPLAPVIFHRLEREGYTVEKAYFESWPGFYVTGNLYRPRGRQGPFPGVLSPHGHWGRGRFADEGEPAGGVPMRAIALARLGCVVFTYDMVGYGDSKRQIGHSFASEQNELWGLSLMKLQLWNAIRGLDFLASLPDVDPERLACTGASGGGTQTFILMAVDERVKVAAPVCMVSAFMQGGCECENAPLLRLDTINPEIAALMAPRPLILVSASGDWTSKTPSVELPMVRSVYELLGAADRLAGAHFEAPHNYNRDSREAVYNFFLKWLLGAAPATPYKEPPYTLEKLEDVSVWHGRELPPGALDRPGLEALLREEAKARLRNHLPKDAAALARFRETIGAYYRHAVYIRGRTEGGPSAAEFLGMTHLSNATAAAGTACLRLCIARDDQKLPALFFSAPPPDAGRATRIGAVLVIHPDGKAALIDAARGRPGPLLEALLGRNLPVLAIDTFLTGEFHSAYGPTPRARADKMFTTYNRTTLVERVRDIAAAAAFLEAKVADRIAVIGLGRAGKWVALAAPYLPDRALIIADLKDYASESETAWQGDDFAPHILGAGGLETACALAAPRPLICFSAGPAFRGAWILAAYAAAGATDRLSIMSHNLTPEELAGLAAED